MQKLYQAYKDIAEFFIVYIREAHAADGRRPVAYAKELGIKEHTTYGERCVVASRLTKDKKLTIPCLIDGMDNAVEALYHGWPDRIYLVRTDGKLAVAAKRGPFGFRPALSEAKAWLAEYKDTGKELAFVSVEEEKADFGALNQELFELYQAKKYEQALVVAEKISKLEPLDVGIRYNTACLHCLLGDKERAYTWLQEAIDAGFDDEEELLTDEDFTTIRHEDRFQALVKRIRDKSRGKETNKGDSGAFVAVVGVWEMVTSVGEQSIESTMSLSVRDGRWVGTWISHGLEMEMQDLALDGNRLSFKRTIPGGGELSFEGTIDGKRISGTYHTPLGELQSNGVRKERSETPSQAAPAAARPDSDGNVGKTRYRGLLGADSKKIKVESRKTYLWASGDRGGKDAEWYDFTGAPIPPAQLQFGIGRDRIASIDDPLFVDPDDPRLLELPASPYRRDERPKSNDEIVVIGFANGDDVRAYPAALLDRHELVNDVVGGKPVTVGW